MHADPDPDPMTSAAHKEVARMRAAIRALPPGGSVTMSCEQFGKLATLIDRLAAPRGCSDPDCFHAPVDGFRWWVPIGEVERERSDLSVLRDENRRLCTELLRARPLR